MYYLLLEDEITKDFYLFKQKDNIDDLVNIAESFADKPNYLIVNGEIVKDTTNN